MSYDCEYTIQQQRIISLCKEKDSFKYFFDEWRNTFPVTCGFVYTE